MLDSETGHRRTLNAVARDSPHLRADGICLDFSDRHWTLSQLLTDAGRLANGLRNAGVTTGDAVAVAAGAIPEQFLLLFATTRLGAVHVPVNSQWQTNEVQHLIDEVEPRVVIVDERRAAQVLPALHPKARVRVFVIPSAGGSGSPPAVGDGTYEPFGTLQAAHPLEDDVAGPTDPAVIFYTSGTTGRSKGAVWTHECLIYNSLAWSERFNVGLGDVAFGSYDGRGSALAVGMIGPLLSGATLIGGERVRRGWLGMAETIVAREVTLLMGAPAMLTLIARDAKKAGISELPCVRQVILGSAALPPSLIPTIRSFCPNAEIHNCYGATEGHISSCSNEELFRKPGAVGRPLPGTELQVRNEDGAAISDGDIGYISVRGPGVMARYYKRPELTQSVFSDGWLRTGDMGHIDADGCLWLNGRASESINTGGWSVDAVEVENAIAQVKGVGRVAVIGRPDPIFGQSIVAYIQPEPDTQLTSSGIQEHCAKLLARYKWPRRIEFRSDLPVNSTMKIQKHLITDDNEHE